MASVHPARRFAACAALFSMLSACAVGPDFLRPPAPAETHYASGADPTATLPASGVAQRFAPGGKVAADWWRLFNAPKIQAVLDEAVRSNPGLQAAQASLRASQNNLRSGYGVFFPQVEGDAHGEREKFSAASIGENSPPSIFNLFTLSASVTYALDVFGGERRTVEALGAQVDYERATEQATYLALTSNIVNTMIAKAAYRAQVDTTERLVGMQKEQVGLAEIQANSGTAPYANVLSLRSQLASYEATIPQLEQKITQADDLLATLAGHAPADWQPPEITLADIALPSQPPVSLPSDLVRQRPDILAAEATAHAASADIGVATAALLPSITLSGTYGTNNTKLNNLFAANSNFGSIGAGLSAPLFEGGTLWFRRKAAIDTYDQAMASYRETVLAAFAQVADTLRALEHDAAALATDDEAVATAEQALQLIQANYQAGIATYLDVLNADAQFHQAQISELQAVALRYQDTVALFTALGGGWWNRGDDAAMPGAAAPSN